MFGRGFGGRLAHLASEPKDVHKLGLQLPSDTSDRRQARHRRIKGRRTTYSVRLMSTTALSLLLLIAAFKVDFKTESTFEVLEAVPQVVQIEEVVQTDQIMKPPPPPRPPVPIEVPNDEVLEDVVLDIDAEIDFDEPAELPPPPPPVVEEEPEPDIFVVVEEMPEIQGGLERLYKDLKYPELAQKAQMEGMSVIQVIIDETGVPSQPTVLRSAGQILDSAAIDALLKQRFKPGRQRGKAVRVRMSFPITFRLS